MKRHEPLHMKPTPTAFRIFRAVMVAITAALLLIALNALLYLARCTAGLLVV